MRPGVHERLSLADRVALVTGGGGHVGREAAHTLAELGADLALLDRDEGRATEVAKEIKDVHGRNAHVLALDLERAEDVRSVAGRVAERFGRLDVVVQAAAFVGSDDLPGWSGPFESQSFDTFARALDVNLGAPFLLVQTLLPLLRTAAGASVVQIGSIHASAAPDPSLYAGTDMGHPAAYAASKGGLLQLTRWLATMLAPHVRVNSISPGGIARGQPRAFVRRYEARTPLGRMARETDLSGAIAYLASDLSSYVTGQNLIVDGGYTVW